MIKTRRPKNVIVEWLEVVTYEVNYECPTCKVHYLGAGPAKNVTRFICSCGQELIVRKE